MGTRTSSDIGRDVVVLVPGFLGFTRFGNFSYFADRVMAVLRGALEAQLGHPVPVVPCTTLPTHRLAARQAHLLRFLQDLTGKVPGVERFHLVGHSTGGVDAQLLTCEPKLSGAPWTVGDMLVRRKIKSVTTIAAPHYGTALADSALARFVERGWPTPAAVPAFLRVSWDLLRLLPQQIEAPAALHPDWTPEALKFVLQVVQHRELIADLRPAAMEALRLNATPDLEIALSCFVTAAEPRVDIDPPSEPFFVDLYGLTKPRNDRPTSPAVKEAIALLTRLTYAASSDALIRSPVGKLPDHIGCWLNDGVVNTARQIVNPGKPAELGGIVVADHGDVLGHYDRRDALIPGAVLNAGLFHSGAGFGDDEFFTLYQRVAEHIVRAVRRERPAETPLRVVPATRRRRPPGAPHPRTVRSP